MNKTNNVKIDIKAQTAQATTEIKRLNSEMRKMGTSARKSNRDLKSQTTQLKQTTRSFASLTKHLSQLAIIYGAFRGLQTTVRTFAQFETSVSRLGVISGATTTQLKLLKAEAEHLGETTVFTASQVADGMNSMAMAGLTAEESLAGIASVLSLSSIGMMAVEQSALIATTAMNGFGLEASDMGRISDVMAKTITTSATTIQELGNAYEKVGSVATAFGVSLETTSASLGVLADAGRRGSEAGTQLKIVMARLAGNKEASKYIKQLGADIYDANGNLLPFTEQLRNMKTELDKLSPEKRNLKIAEIFGTEALASANILLGKIDEIEAKVTDLEHSFGFAGKKAKEMMDNLTGDYKEFNSALEGLIITLGTGLSPALRAILDEATEFIQALDKGEIEDFGEGVGDLVDMMFDLVKATVSIIGTVRDFSKEITSLTEISGSAQVKLLLLGSALSKLYIVGVALTASYAGLTVATTASTASTITNMGVTAKVTKATKLLTIAQMALNKVLNLNPYVAVGTLLLGVGAIINSVTSSNREMAKTVSMVTEQLKENNVVIGITKESLQDIGKEGREAFGDYLRDKINDTEKAITKLNDAIEEEKNKWFESEEAIKSMELQSAQLVATQKGLIEQEKTLITVNKRAIDISEEKKRQLIAEAEATKRLIREKEILGEKETKTYNKIISNLNDRVAKTKDTLLKLYSDESKHKDKLIKIEEEVAKAREEYANTRKANALDLKSELFEISNQGLSDFKKYKKTQARLAELASKAEKAYVKGNYVDFQLYADQYNALRRTYNGEEISHQEKVRIGTDKAGKAKYKQQKRIDVAQKKAHIDAMANAETGFKFANMSASIKLADAEKLAKAKRANELASLKATRTQIALQLTTLEIMIHLQEVASGVKINADLSSFKQAIVDMDNDIDAMANEDREVKLAMALKKGGTEAEIQALQQIISTPTPLPVEFVSEEAKKEAEIAKDVMAREPIKAKMSLNVKEAKEEAKAFRKGKELSPIQWEAKMDLVTAKTDLKNLREDAEKYTKAEHKALVDKAIANIERLRKIASADIIVDVYERYHPAPRPKKYGGLIEPNVKLPRFDTGGHLDDGVGHSRKRGKLDGYGGGDKIKALLEAGEFIIRKEAVKALGLARLHQINQGEIPRFNMGGYVPPIQKFSTGGDVKIPTEVSKKTINLNLNFGGKTFKMFSDEAVAVSLAKELKRSSF